MTASPPAAARSVPAQTAHDALAPSVTERLSRARADLRLGVPVVLTSGTRAVLALAAETVAPDRLAALRALGPAVLAITARRAGTLKARAYDDDVARIVLPPDLSDVAAADWVRAVADPAADLATPLKGPLRSDRDGPADLHRAAILMAKSARLLPAAIVVPVTGALALAAAAGLTLIDAEAAVPVLAALSPLHEVSAARVPMELAEAGRLHVFRPEDGAEEHYAVEIGRPDRDRPVLARLHSACFTGDVLGSLKCDCGPQLHAALAQMAAEGTGVLLYLNQEGRGIGLANKMRAYFLQDQGFDTVEANHRLGFEDDERDFRIGSAILQRMGFSQVRLLTNNPAKVAMMQSCGLTVVERVALKVGRNPLNSRYLDTKALKSGHIL